MTNRSLASAILLLAFLIVGSSAFGNNRFAQHNRRLRWGEKNSVTPLMDAGDVSSKRTALALQHRSHQNCNGSFLTLKMSEDDSSSEEYNNSASSKIRYLGAGEDAIVRPGCVLVAPSQEFDHFLMESAVFVYAIGLDDNEDMVIRGVIIDHPTAFTIGEMSPNVMGGLSKNLLFRGGRNGKDTAMLLHSSGAIESATMIGSSGIYEGGIVPAMESVDAGILQPEQCKFFFNYMEFRELELNDMFAGVEDGDAWVSLEVPPEFVLDSDLERGQMWSRLRNHIQQIRSGS